MNNLAVKTPNITDAEHSKSNKKIYAKTKGYSFKIYEKEWVLDKNSTINLNYIHQKLNDIGLTQPPIQASVTARTDSYQVSHVLTDTPFSLFA